ncbi:MAG: imidazole glycerol phosphate synthase subunit HisH [Chitinophagales bacterium]|nr:imidazole glycerol phosphate synthase subunit HisH [Chitinophagales bacterium]
MIAIVKYNAGNIRSVYNAVTRLGFDCAVTDDHEIIRKAEKVIFPGVGQAKSAMAYLREKRLDALLVSLKQPVLGICLGLQLLSKHTEEGDTPCLGVFNTRVKKFPPLDLVPHMGWNNLQETKGILFHDITSQNDVYFVHSYYAEICEQTIATTNHIITFSAAIQKDNFYATQFHPEKSGAVGEQILKNFLNL